MLLINANNEYPRYIGDLQLEHEDWQEGDVLPTGWFEVEETEPPICDFEIETLVQLPPVKKNGKFVQVWDKRLLTQEELDYANLQRIKNKVALGQLLTAEEAALLTE
jgi:hypothetical protein